jgi:hypothetical protein
MCCQQGKYSSMYRPKNAVAELVGGRLPKCDPLLQSIPGHQPATWMSRLEKSRNRDVRLYGSNWRPRRWPSNIERADDIDSTPQKSCAGGRMIVAPLRGLHQPIFGK